MRMNRAMERRGFTLVEVAIVLMVGSILIGVAVPQMQRSIDARDVRGARDGVMMMAVQARARAMERSRTVEFHLDGERGSASVVEGGDTLEVFDFADSGVVATSTVDDVVLCYSSRGFATEPCSTSIGSEVVVRFERSGQTAALEIWQLGQLRKL